jgi:large subunit ribosomal protein L17
MRHRKQGRKLNRTSSHRDAMFRNMVTSLFKYERIKTTDAKAKELRIWADNMVTLAKRGDLHARRQALAIIREKAVVHKLFEETVQRYANVSGGYTRIVKLGYRTGDAAKMALVELVDPAEKAMKKEKPKKAQPAAATLAKDEDTQKEALESEEVPEETPVEAVPEDTVEVEKGAAESDTPAETAEAEAPETVEAEAVETNADPEPAEQEAQAASEEADDTPKDKE